MTHEEEKILLGHGNGGRLMQRLISGLFLAHFGNPILNEQSDAALLHISGDEIAFTTDSFVVDPVFFPGGNIGKLAVCGTVNDLSVSGAEPLYLSVSFIIEEGLPLAVLEKIVCSMAEEARKAGVLIVTGDTKVVNRGKCDKLFINTAGIGKIRKDRNGVVCYDDIKPGDKIILNGPVGDHGLAVMSARESFSFRSGVESDCTSLNRLIGKVLDSHSPVKFMRDPTRGGLVTALNELATRIPFGIRLKETAIPVSNDVSALCELLGFDPLYIANEGKVIVVSGEEESRRITETMKQFEEGRQACVIGEILNDHPGRVVLQTMTGSTRILETLTSDQLPRIC